MSVEDLLASFWRWKFVAIVIVAVCTLVAFWVAATTPPTYLATATLVVGPPGSTDGAGAETARTFRSLVASQTVVSQIVEEFNLADPPHALQPLEFLNGNLDVQVVNGTSLLLANVRFSEPDLAADIANRVAELSVDLHRTINQSDLVTVRDLLETHRSRAREELDRLEPEFALFLEETQIEPLRQEANTLLWQVAELTDEKFEIQRSLRRQENDEAFNRLQDVRAALLEFRINAELPRQRATLTAGFSQRSRLENERSDLIVSLGGIQSELDAAVKEIDTRPQLMKLRRLVEDYTALANRPRGGGDADQTQWGVTLLEEVLNPTHAALDERLAIGSVTAAGLAARLQEVERRLVENAAELGLLQSDVAEKEAVLEALTREFDLANREYMRLVEISPEGLSAALVSIITSEREVRSTLERAQSRLAHAEVARANLQLGLDLSREAYQAVAREYEEIELRIASGSAQLRVVDRALVPNFPVAPRKRLVTLIGFLVGIGLSAAVVLVLESLA